MQISDILKIEWLKFRRYKPAIVLILGFLLAVVSTNLVVYTVQKKIVKPVDDVGITSGFNPFSFEHVWGTVSYTSGYLLIIPAMLMILLVANEYSNRTHRQNIITGWSRLDFMKAKFGLALLLTSCCTLIVFLTAFVFGLFADGPFSMNGFSNIGFFALKSLNYFLIATLISVLVKRTGFAIGVYFLYLGAENIVGQILYSFSAQFKMVKRIDLGDMSDYLPMGSADGLLAFPDNPLKTMVGDQLPQTYFIPVLLIALAYCFLFAWWSLQLFRNRDL